MTVSLHLTHLRRVAVVAAVALVLVVLMLRQETTRPALSATASPISGLCVGFNQGTIKGESTVKGREGTYNISASSHGITSPRDAASGLPTGRRQHKPMTITMELGKSGPRLITALTTNETLKTCTFNYWETTPSGTQRNYFRIVLKNALLVDYSMSGRPGGADTLTLSFTYQSIEWTYTNGGITAVDDWERQAN